MTNKPIQQFYSFKDLLPYAKDHLPLGVDSTELAQAEAEAKAQARQQKVKKGKTKSQRKAQALAANVGIRDRGHRV